MFYAGVKCLRLFRNAANMAARVGFVNNYRLHRAKSKLAEIVLVTFVIVSVSVIAVIAAGVAVCLWFVDHWE